MPIKGANTTDESKLSRLGELPVVELRGFGSFSTHLGGGVYGPELESTVRRQSLSSEPTTRAAGIRAPINHRIAKGSASLTCGCPNTKYAEGARLLLGDFYPWREGSFFDYRPTDSKTENRPQEPVAVNMFEKCATAQSRYFAGVYGEEHPKHRLDAIKSSVNTHEDHPKATPIDSIGGVWNRANRDFADACLEGVRRIMRIAPSGFKSL